MRKEIIGKRLILGGDLGFFQAKLRKLVYFEKIEHGQTIKQNKHLWNDSALEGKRKKPFAILHKLEIIRIHFSLLAQELQTGHCSINL